MIIKIIPETEAEKAKHKEITFSNVREFFMVGNRRDEDGYMVDFHEWEGSYKYLLTSLHWFYGIINDERKDSIANKEAAPRQPLIKRGEVSKPSLQIVDTRPPIQFAPPIEEQFAEEQQELAEEDPFPDPFPEPQTQKIIPMVNGKFPKPPPPFRSAKSLTPKIVDEITENLSKKYDAENVED